MLHHTLLKNNKMINIGLFGSGTQIILWIGFIISLLFALWLSVQSIINPNVPHRLVLFFWMIPIILVIILFLDGVVAYIQENKEVGIVIGFLFGVYLYLFPGQNSNNNKLNKK